MVLFGVDLSDWVSEWIEVVFICQLALGLVAFLLVYLPLRAKLYREYGYRPTGNLNPAKRYRLLVAGAFSLLAPIMYLMRIRKPIETVPQMITFAGIGYLLAFLYLWITYAKDMRLLGASGFYGFLLAVSLSFVGVFRGILAYVLFTISSLVAVVCIVFSMFLSTLKDMGRGHRVCAHCGMSVPPGTRCCSGPSIT